MSWSRRAFLSGAGAVVALPWLPSLRLRAEDAVPTRFVGWFCPNGMHTPAWTPSPDAMSPFGWALSPILSPLADLQDAVTVVSGLANTSLILSGGAPHSCGTASFLSAVPVSPGVVHAGVSADQVMARALGPVTPFPSLQVGLQEVPAFCDAGYSCVYTTCVSWAAPDAPLPALTHPRLLFERLFGGGGTVDEAAKARRVALRRSVLDHAIGEITALETQLSAVDRARLDQYLTAVREVERRVDIGAPSCVVPARPPEAPDFDAAMASLTDLMVLALQCDLTRVITFMMGFGGSTRDVGFLGISGSHHPISHHQGLQENFDKLLVINRWEIEWFATFLRKLRAVEAGAGTLLDATAVVLGSEVSDGDTHGLTDLPTLVAGGGNGRLVPGQHLSLVHEPMANLWVSMLDVMGAATAAFGEHGTRNVPGLLG